METPITAVFEGGGIRGIALAGAAAAALDHGYRFERVVGTSAGAVVSSLVASGFDSEELRHAVIDTDWPVLLGRHGRLRKHLSMLLKLGFHSGESLERVVSDLLATKGVGSFGDLAEGSLRIVSTDLNHGRGIVLPDDLPSLGHDPQTFSVARAVLMSASIPFVLEPVRFVDQRTGEELLLADGAMASRFPAQLVPRDPSTVGFRLRHPKDWHSHQDITGPISLATAVIGAGITAREDLPPLCGALERVVEIEVDQDSLDFDVPGRRAREIFDVGYAAARQVLVPVADTG